MSLVEIRDVDKHFGPLQVLKRVSLDVAEGEIVAIIGRSGSGKSTLLRCINGLEPIQGGTIRVDSDLVNAPKADLRKLRQKVGIVFQSYNLFPHLTVELQMQQITGINRIPFLVTDKVDIVIAVMGATPERAKQIMFSSPYASLYIGVFGPQDLPLSSADGIGDYTVGVPRGATQDISITEMAPDANIVRFEDDATTAAAYLSGQVDLFGTANILVQDMVKKNPDLDLVNKFVIRRSPAHMGVRHGEFNLLRWLDTFIFYGKMNGTLEQLHQKWMGESMKPMPSF